MQPEYLSTMDVHNLSPLVGPPTPSARNPGFPQPTYTTAGTLYNPSTSQPLQAPTRRGRQLRNMNGPGQASPALLPRSQLAALPLQGFNDRSQVYHQYSPLQQNTDRAVSPGNPVEPEKNPYAMSSGNGHPAHTRSPGVDIPAFGFGREAPNNNITAQSAKSDDDDESDGDLGTNPLHSMTVKSLQNLASYPNPSQEGAQKALLRGARPNLNGESSRQYTPDNHQQYGPGGRPRPRHGPACHTDWVQSNARPLGRDNNPSMLPRRPPPGLEVRDDVTGYLAAAGGAGGGVPRPLTAGPPGQRQYRPSTFEPAFRALGINAGLPTASKQHEAVERSGNTPPTLFNGNGRISSLLINAPQEPGPVGHRHLPDYRGIIAPRESGMSDRAASPDNALIVAMRQGKGMPIKEMGNNGPSWKDADPDPRFRREPGTCRFSEDAKEARARETDRLWYAGAGLLNIGTADVGEDMKIKWKTTPYKPMSIDEANKESTADHMKPLLNAALATFERCAQEEWFKEILARYD